MARISDDMEAFLAMLQGAHGAHGGGSPAPAGAVRVGPAQFGPDESSAFDSALAKDRKTQERNALAQNLFNAGAIFQGQLAKAPAAPVSSAMQEFVARRQLTAEGTAAAAAKQPAPAEWGAPAGLTRPEALGQGWAKKSEHQMKPGEGPAPAEWGAPAGMTSDQAIRAGYAKNPKEMDVAHGPATEADRGEMTNRGMNADLAATHGDAVHYISQHDAAKAALTRTNTAGGGGAALTPQALNMLAAQFATTGAMPPLGMGRAAAAQRAGIVNKAAENFPETDIASNKASFAANQGSLVALQKQKDAVDAFEQTAGKNLDLFLEQSKKIMDSGSPLLNKPLRAIQGNVLGDPNMIAFKTARQVALTEIAKVLTNPGLSGQLSDSARHEVEQLVSPDATLAQIHKAATILKTDMANRKASMDEQIGAIRGRVKLKKGGGEGSAHADPL